MGERKKEQTFVSRHRTGLALLKIVHKVDSAVIPLRIIQTVLDVAGSYLGLYHARGLCGCPARATLRLQ